MKLRVFWGGKFRTYNDISDIRRDCTPTEIRDSHIEVLTDSMVVGTLDAMIVADEIQFLNYEEQDKTGLELMYLMDNRVYETV